MEKGGTALLQGLDYVYTIQGWLKSVNDPTLTVRDPGRDGYSAGTHSDIGYQTISGSTSSFTKDIFGFAIDYFNGDYKRDMSYISYNTQSNSDHVNYYDGKIKSTRWGTRTTMLGCPHSVVVKYLTRSIIGELTLGPVLSLNTPVAT